MNLIKKHLVLVELPVNESDDPVVAETEVAQVLEQAKVEAEATVEKARREAEEIVRRASEEAKATREEAAEEAEKLKREAMEKGYHEGLAKAEEVIEVLNHIAERYQNHLHALEEVALSILLEVFEIVSRKLFDEVLEDRKKLLETNLKRALKKLRRLENVIVRVNERDYEEFGEDVEKILSPGGKIRLKPDAGVKRSEVLIETDYGVVEASPYRILEEFGKHLEELKDAVSPEVERVQGES